MDNFRVVRRYETRPRQAVDGFARATQARQTLQQATTPAPSPVLPAEPVVATVVPPAPVPEAQQTYLETPIVPTPVPEPQPPAAVTPEASAETPESVEPDKPSPFDIALIPESEIPKNRLSAGRAFKKWLLRSGLATMILLVAVGGTLFAQGYSKVHKVFRGTDKPAALSAGAAQQLLKGESGGRVNFLLLGNGGDGHQAPDLTDTLIVASFDVVHKTAVMISVPRDLWVQVPGYGNMKINAAYEVGKYNYLHKIDDSNENTDAVFAGFKQADKAVQSVLGISINYNVLVNFTSFKQAVDAVGGVTINVPEALVDPTMAWENHRNPVLAAAGTQVMNGKQALLYVRSRETSSDFARSQRQRSVIVALKDKVLTAGTLSNPLKVSQLINAFGDNLVTDMSLSEGMRAYNLGKGVANDKITSLDLVTPPNNLVTTGPMNGVSIALPKAGLFQYADIQAFVQQTLNPPTPSTSSASSNSASTTSTTTPETAQITVLNGTTKAGLAAAKANVIKGAGYNVIQVGNAPTKTYTKTVIVDLSNGADPKTKSYLEATFGTTSTTTLPAGITAGTANFIVILGAEQSL